MRLIKKALKLLILLFLSLTAKNQQFKKVPFSPESFRD